MTSPGTDALLQRNRELFVLNHIAETLNRTSDIQSALDDTLASVVELMGLQTGWVFLLNDAGKLYLAAHHELPPALDYPGSPWLGSCNCHALFRSGELHQAINIVQCSRLGESEGDRRGLEFHASAPLRSQERMLGILNVASPGWDTVTPDALLLLSAVGAQLGTAIERTRLGQQAVSLATAEERNRIAREIHDTLAQGLTAIALNLEAAQALQAIDQHRADAKIAQALELARTNLEEARRSVLDLRAAPLEGRSLPEALRALAEQWTLAGGVPIATKLDTRIGPLSPALENGLFRIAQEALSNIRQHAHANQVELRLTRRNSTLRLLIRDDGRGFDPQALAHGDGRFGIAGMRERARLLGGTLKVVSAPGRGTQIELRIEN